MMRKGLALCLMLTLAGCGFGQSRFNPLNWFGKSEPAARVELAAGPKDDRLLVAQVLSLTVEPIGSGAIVRASGLTPTQGWWNADLVEVPSNDPGVLVFDFRIEAPQGPTDVNTPRSRQVTVATHLSNRKLSDVRSIVVQGASDARSVGR